MKFYFSILLSLIMLFAKGQGVRFQLHRINPCNGKETPDDSYGSYYLTDTLAVSNTPYFFKYASRYVYSAAQGDQINLSKDHIFAPFDSENLVLPKTGKYYLFIDELDNPEAAPIPIDIRDTGVFVFKYQEAKVILQHDLRIVEPDFFYRNCDMLAEGYVEDFYPNGKIRLRGNFVKGKTKDSLVLFYANGNIFRQRFRFPKENQDKIFDSLGNLRSISQSSRKYATMFTPEYTIAKAYFENGRLSAQLYERNKKKKWITLIRRYFENGKPQLVQTKKSRIEYYENGNKKVVYTWKIKKRKYHSYDEIIKRNIYNENEKLTETIEYENWDSGFYSPTMDVSRSDWIDKWIIYKNGKAIIKAEDVATNTYFGNTDNQK